MRQKYLSQSDQTKLILRLCQALAQIKSPEEAAALITDLLSRSEINMIAKRLKIAEKIIAGSTYEGITDELKVGHNTIARVGEWLKLSGTGYRTIIGRLEKLPEMTGRPVRLSQMEKRYPAYYWPQVVLKEIVGGASKRQKERLEKTLSQLSSKTQLYKELSILLRPTK